MTMNGFVKRYLSTPCKESTNVLERVKTTRSISETTGLKLPDDIMKTENTNVSSMRSCDNILSEVVASEMLVSQLTIHDKVNCFKAIQAQRKQDEMEKEKTRIDKYRRRRRVGTESQFIPQYKLENTKLPRFMLLHFGRVRIIWDWFILIIVAYIAIVVPFNVTFKRNNDIYYSFLLDLSFEIFFIIDIIINFRTTFIQPKSGRLITDSKEIAKHYMKGWFFIDCVAALPFELLYFVNHQWVFLVSVLKTGRLLRLFRVGRRVTRYLEYTATLLILMMVSFGLLAHWFACIWYVIGYEELENGKTTGWLFELRKQLKYPEFTNSTSPKQNPTDGEKYITALYFVFTSLTTVGFGNIAPNTVAEKTFSVLILLLGAIAQSAIFGNMTAVIQKLYAARAKFHSKATQIKQFVRHHQIEGDLRRRIEDWFISHWSVSKGVNTDEMLESFPQELQADICLHLYKSFLTLPCFMNASRGCLRSISLKVRKAYFSPGELLIKEKDAINSIFYVQRGTLEIVQRDFIVAILGTGDLFGEDISKVKIRQRSNGDVRALMYCDILYITRENIKEVFRSYPDFTDHFSNNIGLAFDLAEKQNKLSVCNSIGLRSIEEENEDTNENEIFSSQSSTDSDEDDEKSSFDSDHSDDRKTENGRRPQRRKLNHIPLWQQKIRQQERFANASPSASLKNCLSKIDAQLSNDEDVQSDTLFLNSYTNEQNDVIVETSLSNYPNDDVERNVNEIRLSFDKQYSSDSENEAVRRKLLADRDRSSIEQETNDSLSIHEEKRFWNFFENPHPDEKQDSEYETNDSKFPTLRSDSVYSTPRKDSLCSTPRRLRRTNSSAKQSHVLVNTFSIDKDISCVKSNGFLVKDRTIEDAGIIENHYNTENFLSEKNCHNKANSFSESSFGKTRAEKIIDSVGYLDADLGKHTESTSESADHPTDHLTDHPNKERIDNASNGHKCTCPLFDQTLIRHNSSIAPFQHHSSLPNMSTCHTTPAATAGHSTSSFTNTRTSSVLSKATSSELNEEDVKDMKNELAKMRDEINDIKGSLNTLTDLVRTAINQNNNYNK